MEKINKKKIINNIIIITIILILILIVFVVKKINEKNKVSEINNLSEELIENSIYENEFNNQETKANYTLYNFGYEGCYYCTVMEPIFKKYKDSYSNITFTEIDIYEKVDLADKYGVQYTPTFIIVDSNGKQIDKIVGAVSEEKFIQFVEKYK